MGKVLVVGGSGFVGSVLVDELLTRGYGVKVLDRLFFGDHNDEATRNRIEVTVEDMRSMTAEMLDGVDAVINVGGLSNDPTAEYNPHANYEMNTVASQTISELCKQNGVRRYIYASSCSVYDRGVGNGQDDVLQDETTEVNPKAVYSGSKYAAERHLLSIADTDFCPVILRKGTIFGFSPRMRYDLVVNAFVKDAMSKGAITLHYGGEMWRPLLDVRDAARAYIAALEAPEDAVRGEIFNVSYQNLRISELGLRVREALRGVGIETEIRADYGYQGVRSYRVRADKIEKTLGIRPQVTIEDSVAHMVENIRTYKYTDFGNPIYYNIDWMTLLERAQKVIDVTGTVFGGESKAGSSPVYIWEQTGQD